MNLAEQKPDDSLKAADAPQTSPSDQLQSAQESLVENGTATQDTFAAPSFPGSPPPEPPIDHRPFPRLKPGNVIGGFEIVRWRGGGAAGDVYLAREQSLGRRVALKVTRNIGSEARTMAMLEKHRHIVRVIWQGVDESCNARLISMEYVPGATLGEVLRRLRLLASEQLSGQALLDAVSSTDESETAYDADAARDRERHASASYRESVYWLVARMAEALHFAHQLNVKHRDIKPDNILINTYGQPLLADFSVSSASCRDVTPEVEVFGGTVEYMAPEHLRAFDANTPEAVDERSDIYSLGVVLYELIALKLPHAVTTADKQNAAAREALAQRKLSLPAPLRDLCPDVPYALEHVAFKCLAGDAAERFASAGQLAESLDGCRLLEIARKRLPRRGILARSVARAPMLTVMTLGFLPHLLGTLYNPAYNALILFPRYNAEYRVEVFLSAALYGVIVFPLLIAFVVNRYLPSWRVWRRLNGDSPPEAIEVNRARLNLLQVPTMAVKLAIAGWFPLLVFIPVYQYLRGAGFIWSEYAHFAVSVLLSFLVASTYSFFALQYVVVCLFFVEFWADARKFIQTSRVELADVPAKLRWFQAGAFLPLVGAILVLLVGPQSIAAGSYLAFASLMICLIGLAMVGAFLSIHVGGLISKAVDALLSVDRLATTTDSHCPSAPI
jgi:serine/threonine protein kinase